MFWPFALNRWVYNPKISTYIQNLDYSYNFRIFPAIPSIYLNIYIHWYVLYLSGDEGTNQKWIKCAYEYSYFLFLSLPFYSFLSTAWIKFYLNKFQHFFLHIFFMKFDSTRGKWKVSFRFRFNIIFFVNSNEMMRKKNFIFYSIFAV